MIQNGHTKPTFETLADETLDRVRGIYAQRGTEYADTWKNPQMLKMKATASKLGINLPDECCKAMALAALADVKYSRFAGGYKEDNVDDGISYDAAWAAEMRRLDKMFEARKHPELNAGLNGNGYNRLAGLYGVEQARDMILAGHTQSPEPAPATPSV